MRRFDLIQMLVLDEISDDFEEPQHIHERLAHLSERCQLTITQENVRQALTDLVQSGRAKAYRLSLGDPGEEIQGAPPPERANDYYYWITDEGRKIQEAFDGCPFDGRGGMIPGWRPPAE
jgi:hypothetical protein